MPERQILTVCLILSGGWCWFIIRKQYCSLAGGWCWFGMRENWLVSLKSELYAGLSMIFRVMTLPAPQWSAGTDTPSLRLFTSFMMVAQSYSISLYIRILEYLIEAQSFKYLETRISSSNLWRKPRSMTRGLITTTRKCFIRPWLFVPVVIWSGTKLALRAFKFGPGVKMALGQV